MMAICQYFLKGTCKFGSTCRNEHPSGGYGKSSSFGGLAKSSFGSTGWQGAGANQETDKLIQSIKQEMLSWEISKIWPFSSFCPSKERPCLSDLKDYSPEEIRLEAYKAKESGTTSEYLTGIKQISDQFMKRRSELKSLTTASWNQELQKATGQTTSNSGGLFQTQKSTSSLFSSPSSLFSKPQQQSGSGGLFSSGTAKQSLFGSTTGQPLFGQQSTLGSAQQSAFGSQPKSAFGSGQPAFGSGQQSSFGSTQSAFGSTQQSGIGSGQSLFSSQKSAFGSGNQSLFGSQQSGLASQSTTTLFGQNTTSQQGSGLFSQTPQQAGKGLFSQQTPTPATSGLFSQQQQQQSSQPSGTLFGQQQNTAPKQGLFTQQNLFGQTNQQQQQSNPFGQASSGLFSSQQTANTQSVPAPQQPAVLQTAQTSTAAPTNQNPFMQAAMQQQPAPVSAVAEIASTLKISEKDLQAFKADRFICGQVPECPPPPELC